MRILYLDLDALTPSHLSCYGYHRKTSPTIDAIAAEGLRCTNVYCSDAPCLPSRTALYQGRFGIHTGVVGHGGTAADTRRQGPMRGFRSTYEEESFPRRLQMAGYHTAMISPFGQRHAAHQYYAGFHEMHNTGQGGNEPVEVVQPVVDRWLEQNAARDHWYLHVNYWDIHTPYRAPLSYGNPFENEPLPAWITPETLARHMKTTGPHTALDIGMYGDAADPNFPRVPDRIDSPAKLRQWIDGYDTAIRYVDDQIAKIVAALKKAGVYDDTLIVISADHGENQGELGIYGEHGTADHATCNVPMIIRWPTTASAVPAVRGAVDHGLHYHLDWCPTLLEMIGRENLIPAVWDGTSYAATLRDGKPAGREELIISQCAHVCQRSVRFEQDGHSWLYMRTYHDGFRLYPREMLYDLRADPHEEHDLAASHPAVCREGAWRLTNWHEDQMRNVVRFSADVTDPMWTVIREGGPYHARLGDGPGNMTQRGGFGKYLRRLEETGRADGAARLRAKYPEALNASAK